MKRMTLSLGSYVPIFPGLSILAPRFPPYSKYSSNNSSNSSPLPDWIKSQPKPQQKLLKTLVGELHPSWSKLSQEKQDFLKHQIAQQHLTRKNQLVAGLHYLVSSEQVNLEEFQTQSGLNYELPSEQELSSIIQEHALKYSTKRDLLRAVREDARLKFAEFQQIAPHVNKQLQQNNSSNSSSNSSNSPRRSPTQKKSLQEKFQTSRTLEIAKNSPEMLQQVKQETDGKIITRFPPEPNGFLHIGHTKAMHLSFQVADEQEGITYLRLDDTNPENESQHYIDSIINMVEWMEYKPYSVTYASDYFDEMYDMAVKLIDKGLAYVDFGSQEEIYKQREQQINSPYRDTSPEVNLREFENMKNGKYDAGQAVLRLKIDMQHPMFVMRDFIAYRIKKIPHPRTGNKWCIYPTYDYTHCVTDSLEKITYSLCSLEFENRRDSYYWLLDALEIYKPWVWEFSRLNITQTILSKRNLEKLVQSQVVDGWDDPRMPTLEGLKRRGYTPGGLKLFCEKAGVTRNENRLNIKLLEHCQRQELIKLTKQSRFFGILNPLQVSITGVRGGGDEKGDGGDVDDEKGDGDLNGGGDSNDGMPSDWSRRCKLAKSLPGMTMTKRLYIDSSDFRVKPDPDFYGLVPGGKVKLLNSPYNLCCIKQNEDGSLECELERVGKDLPRGRIHWISQDHCKWVEFRRYKPLFLDDEATELNPKSMEVLNGVVSDEIDFERDHFQFERVGFYHWDREKNVFHETLPLREDKKKKKN